MEKITVSKIVNTKPDKYGTSVRVKSNEHGDKKIFMISVKDASSIQVGETYEGTATLWKEIDGTEWMAWKWPNKQAQQDEALKQINEKLDTIIRLVSKPISARDATHPPKTETEETVEYPTEDSKVDSIPF